MRGKTWRNKLSPRDGGDGFEQTQVTHAVIACGDK